MSTGSISVREQILKDQISIVEKGINRWRIGEVGTMIFSEIFTYGSTILGFSAGYFNDSFLAYLAGAVGLGGKGLSYFSSWCLSKGQAQRIILNNLLIADGQQPIPDLMIPATNDLESPIPVATK